MRWRVCFSFVSLIAVASVACGSEPDPIQGLHVVRDDPSDAPVPGLGPEDSARFDRGDARFSQVFRASQGLGPIYTRTSCEACHANDARGPGFVERAVPVEADGVTPRNDPEAFRFGPMIRPYFLPPATHAVEPASFVGMLRSSRVGPAVFARGWIAAVSDEAIVSAAETQAREGRVSGRVSRLADGRIGRFSLKARIATLADFVADAFVSDMGITTPLRPEELSNPEAITDDARPGIDLDTEAFNDVVFYVQSLAMPRREGLTSVGQGAFERAQCTDCHLRALSTRSDATPALMANTSAELYSDLLLHDMGVGLTDGVSEGSAGPREWRTAPLIGVRFARTLLHDGRALTVSEAIAAHRSEGSEANASITAFEALTESDRRALIAFVERL